MYYVKYYIWLKSQIRKFDKSVILLIACLMLFSYACGIQQWIVVCVPFISSREELLSLKEEIKIIPEQNSSDSFMCLHYSLFFVKFTTPYTMPAVVSLESVMPVIFLCIRQIFLLTGIVLIFLVIFSVATITIPNLSTACKKFRGEVLLIGAICTAISLTVCLVLLITYKEKNDFYSKDVIKQMLMKFTPTYGVSFYYALAALFLNIYLVKVTCFLKPKPKRRSITATL